jgi:hypothetical protein
VEATSVTYYDLIVTISAFAASSELFPVGLKHSLIGS